jgi:outer membrane receptor protein involved in Fe transport
MISFQSIRQECVRHFLALLLAVSMALPVFAQVANDPAPESKTAPAPKVTVAPAKAPEVGKELPNKEDVYVLSPFEVRSEENTGYQGNSAMSGSRLASKIEDIAATMSVVTKEQLVDFALYDINDIFAMEATAEGTRTYTANSTNTNPLLEVDEVAQNPQTANRVRGLGTANVSVGNVAISSAIPLDTYNVDAVEISRGPNSSIFGTGEVSGSVNLVPASANLSRAFTKSSVMASSVGTLRGTVDISRPIVKNKLAVRVSGLVEDRGYTRKPAYDKTRRYTLGATLKPFANTTIKYSFEKYDEHYSRPNSAMPREWMSLWEELGRPSWDPSTNTWTQTKNGVLMTGTIVPTTNTNNNPYFSTATGQNIVDLGHLGSNRVRPSMFIDQGEITWFGNTYWRLDPSYTAAGAREIVQMALPVNYNLPVAYRDATALGYSTIRGSNNKAFYNYDSINLAALNSGEKRAETYRFELEQYFLRTDRHMLGLQLGAFGEDVEDYRRNFVGNGRDGVPLEIRPDVNLKLPTGEANPHYGAPYITALAPQVYRYPVKTATYKANAVYQLDLSHEKNKFVRLLGRQRLLGYAEYFNKKFSPPALRYTDQIITPFADKYVPTGNAPTTADPNRDIALWLAPSFIYNSNSAKWNARYYLGDGQGGNIDYASSAADLSGGAIYNRWGSAGKVNGVQTNSWNKDAVQFGSTYFSQQMREDQNRTKGFVWQGFFWDDRIVPTYGIREDRLRSRSNTTPANINTFPNQYRDANGLYVNDSWLWNFGGSPWFVTNAAKGLTENRGKTKTKGIVVKPLPWLHLRYNQSNSFKPESFAVDYLGEPLPNPYGETKDYGVRINLLNNKLTLGLTKYETISVGSRGNNTVGTIANRLLTMDFDLSTNNSEKNDLMDWMVGEYATLDGIDLTTATPAQVTALEVKAFNRMQLDTNMMVNVLTNARAITTDQRSKGYELEVNYNPSRFWTVRATGAQTEAITSNIGASYQQYRDMRMPIWTTITSPATGRLWWTSPISASNLANTFQAYYFSTVENPMKLNFALQGKPNPQTRKYRASLLTNYKLAGITDNKYLKAMSVGTSVRWEGRGADGFYGKASADGIVRDYDADKPIWDKPHTYVDLTWNYAFSLYKGKVRSNVQFNVRNATENGRLQPYAFNPDGTIVNYRIIEPREFLLTLSFDL